MARFFADLEDLVVANGGTTSRWVDSQLETADADFIGIQAPATLSSTYKIQVSDDLSAIALIENDAGDVAGPGAGKFREYDNICARYWRLLASGAEAGARTFKLKKIYNAY